LGRDVINGGDGVDVIFGSGSGAVSKPRRVDSPQPTAAGPEIARGFGWVVYDGGIDANGKRVIIVNGMAGQSLAGDEGNIIDGGAGNDVIDAGVGDDVVHGGLDNDDIAGLAGNDVLFGDAGDDLIEGDGTVLAGYIGTTAAELHGADVIDGGSGNDVLKGQGGDDALFGGNDNDSLWGDDTDARDTPLAVHGNDALDGGAGNDYLEGGGGNDTLHGGTQNDVLFGDSDPSHVPVQYHGNDYLDGGEGDDHLTGGGGRDDLFGGAGADTLFGDGSPEVLDGAAHGDDYLDGEAGNDVAEGGGGNDIVYGGSGSDTLWGDASTPGLAAQHNGVDLLDGEAGDDDLIGGGRGDVLIGGDGDDTLRGDAPTDIVAGANHGDDDLDGGAGADILQGDGGADTLRGGDGNDTLDGDAGDLDAQFHGDDFLDGGSGNDVLIGNGGADFLIGGAGGDELIGDAVGLAAAAQGADQLEGGDGDDRLWGQGGNDSLFGGAGNDYLQGDDLGSEVSVAAGDDLLDGGSGDDQLFGDGGNDTLLGGEGNDVLAGGTGNDWLDGGSGNDMLQGGVGNDTYVFRRGAGLDTVYDADSAAGNVDRLLLEGLTQADVAFERDIGSPNLRIRITDTNESITLLNYFAGGGAGEFVIETIEFGDGTQLGYVDLQSRAGVRATGTIGNDMLVASDGPDWMAGLGGDDVLYGLGGNDTLLGGEGNDTLDGGAGADHLDGGAGADMLEGGTGGDVYVFQRGGGNDTLFEVDTTAGNFDRLRLVGLVPSDVELLRDAGSSDLVVRIRDTGESVRVVDYFVGGPTGQSVVEALEFDGGLMLAYADVLSRAQAQIAGTAANDLLNGTAGADLIAGAAGDDVLLGNGGDDTLDGGEGDDRLAGEDQTVGAGDGTPGMAGNDRLFGGAGNDTLIGGAGNDLLAGGPDDDVLNGGSGSDTYVFGRGDGSDVVGDRVESGVVNTVRLEGLNAVDVSFFRVGEDLVVGVNGTTDQLRIASQFAAAGPIVTAFTFADGSTWGQTEVAAVATNAFIGTNDRDLLVGTPGPDLLRGLGQEDVYVVNHAGDRIEESSWNFWVDSYGMRWPQNDRVNASVSFTLPAYVEDLYLQGSEPLSGTGNELDNLMSGNGAANTLLGLDGNDGLSGGDGDDLLDGGNGNDGLYGGAGNDTLVGGVGDDLLDGGSGADSMAGGAGNDRYVVDDPGDVVLEAAGGGVDHVIARTNYTMGAEIENATIDGLNAVTLVGNDQANDITSSGSAGARNVIQAGNGNDTIRISRVHSLNSTPETLDRFEGGAGDDTYISKGPIGIWDDVLPPQDRTPNIIETVGGGNDTLVTSYYHIRLPDFVENLRIEDPIPLIDSSVGGFGIPPEVSKPRYTGNASDNLIDISAISSAPDQTGVHIDFVGGIVIDGGEGADRMVGTRHNEIYVVDNSGDMVVEAEGSTSIDTVEASVSYTLPDRVENLTLTSTATINATGNDAANRLVGNAGDNVLEGRGGDDTYVVQSPIWAGLPNWERSATGFDSIVDSGGVDQLQIRGLTGDIDAAVVVSRSGRDLHISDGWSGIRIADAFLESGEWDLSRTVESIRFDNGTVWTLADLMSRLVSGDQVINGSSSNDVLRGGGGQDVLVGGDGNDTLLGGAGGDRLEGGTGHDHYHVESVFDRVVELENQGTDTVFTRVDYTLPENVENLLGTTSNGLALRGNQLSNSISGGAGADDIDGNLGNDWLSGGAGADDIDGGAGDDILEGGEGHDTFRINVGQGADTIRTSYMGGFGERWFYLSPGRVVYVDGEIAFGVGIQSHSVQVYRTSYGHEIRFGPGESIRIEGSGVVDLRFADGTLVSAESIYPSATFLASEGNDSFTGTDDADTVDGLGGNDSLWGRGGNDMLRGGAGDDRLYGEAGDDTLYGDAGNDELNGGSGVDVLVGGQGADTYTIDHPGDVIVEQPGEGEDLVYSFANYTLPENVERLVLGGIGGSVFPSASTLSGTGNSLDNYIRGDGGNNTISGLGGNDYLDGALGADTMIGGTGDDEYVVDNPGDVVTENGGEGNDKVSSSISYALGANVERLTLFGAALTGLGNSLDNTIQGSELTNELFGLDGNDLLISGGGSDLLVGGRGDDRLVAQGAGERFLFARGDGIDTIENWTATGTGTAAGVLALGAGIAASEIQLSRASGSNDLIVSIQGTDDRIVVTNHFSGSGGDRPGGLSSIAFADGTSWSRESIDAQTVIVAPAPPPPPPPAPGQTLIGTAGNDTLVGGAGNDTAYGLDGNDFLGGEGGDDILDGGNGDDYLVGWLGNDQLYGGAGQDLLLGNEGDDLLDGGAAGTHADYLQGGPGNDRLMSDGSGATFSYARGDGNDVIENRAASGSASGTLSFLGSDINAADLNLVRGTGAEANDLLITVVSTGHTITVKDHFARNGTERSGGVSGLWFADNSFWGRADIDRHTQGALEYPTNWDDVLQGTPGNDWIRLYAGSDVFNAGAGDDQAYGDEGNDTLNGEAGNDYLVGGDGNDTLLGGIGGDSLLGEAGDDVLDGGAPGTYADYLQGGTGNDRLISDGSGATFSYAAGDGNDVIENRAASGDANGVLNFLGSSINAVDLSLVRGSGAEGNDLLVTINTTGHTIKVRDHFVRASGVRPGGLSGIWFSDNSYWGRASIDLNTFGAGGTPTEGNDVLNGFDGNDTISGLGGDDVIYGDFGDDILNGDAGNDQLFGEAGNDRLDGGSGQDVMTGGIGNDVYVVDDVGDVVIELAGEGTDRVESSISYTLGAQVENLTLTGTAAINGTGNALANALTGNAADNVLDGGAGADTLAGGLGNDVYLVDQASDVVSEASGAGSDTVRSTVSYTLGANVENLELLGTAAINGTGNALPNTLVGNAANNTLNGGGGADTMHGGAGNDTYVVDNAGDSVLELAGEGTDLVQSSVSYTLGAEVENLTLTGTGAINATGNALANVLTGNSGANRLDGGAGADTMAGGAGNDVYVVDNAGDVVTEAASAGTDRVETSISYTLGANLENLTLTGSAHINGTGNSAANTINGNAGNNRINGGTGADRMAGGAGDDTYVVDNTADVVTEAASAGADLVEASVSFTLGSNVEHITLTGTGAINGTGNAMANYLKGNGAANTLNGGGGNDVLQGGAGNDTLTDTSGRGVYDGGDGADTLTGGTDRQFFAGGLGNDAQTLGGGADIIAFNRGHGADTVTTPATGTGQGETNDTLSLAGIRYSELRLARSGNDLLVKVAGTTDSVNFAGWYAATGNRTVTTLQMIVDSTADYDASSVDPLLNRRVVRLNFGSIVSAFDTAYAANPSIGDWAIPMPTLTGARTVSSDTDAIGGQVAYRYGRDGNLAGLDFATAQAVIAEANFATAAQAIGSGATSGGVRLMQAFAGGGSETEALAGTQAEQRVSIGVPGRLLNRRISLDEQPRFSLAPEADTAFAFGVETASEAGSESAFDVVARGQRFKVSRSLDPLKSAPLEPTRHLPLDDRALDIDQLPETQSQTEAVAESIVRTQPAAAGVIESLVPSPVEPACDVAIDAGSADYLWTKRGKVGFLTRIEILAATRDLALDAAQAESTRQTSLATVAAAVDSGLDFTAVGRWIAANSPCAPKDRWEDVHFGNERAVASEGDNLLGGETAQQRTQSLPAALVGSLDERLLGSADLRRAMLR
jgi:Ca2+-binding RTX toxin-like protein